ncbi:hypothetical protein GCM10008955_35950 [Deinococcus malanensis]|uniref:Nucleotide modification associated domain-containing protein n=1 Tax=Deinococcus malanensis TaxID=1706855 RepID=A0ABQ2F0M5_9DEIO|nr:hypothetical protein [Deinococcus malanensis]GGK38916.1 hypothetical protein GCM10008955_35950 [Deinococcus malanensis]
MTLHILSANLTLIHQELARAGARPPAATPRLVDTPGWFHNTCDEAATSVTTHATHTEQLCGRCGYRAFHSHEGDLLGHHGANGLIVLRRPDHDGDIILTDFPDWLAYRYVLSQLRPTVDGPYSLVVLSEPLATRNEFAFSVLRGRLDGMEDTTLRTYLSTSRRLMEHAWADWRCAVFDRLALPLPRPPRAPQLSDQRCTETGTLDDGREYTLHAYTWCDPHRPQISVEISGDLHHWLTHD